MPDPLVMILAGAGCLIVGIAAFFSAFAQLKRLREVENTPRMKARSAAMGPAELQGLALPIGAPLTGPYSGAPCCWWKGTVEVEGGKQGSWEQVEESRSDSPFILDDGTGQVRVLPAGAEVRASLRYSTISGGLGLFSFAGDAAAGWGSRRGRRRYREWRIDPQLPVFAMGVLRPDHPDAGDPALPVLARGLLGEPFLLSGETKLELDQDLSRSVAWRFGGGFLLMAVGALLLAVYL
jgi:hypothetical protein